MLDQTVIPGSTKAAHQFGRELLWRLDYLSAHPHEVCKYAPAGTMLNRFQEYIRGRPGLPSEFRLVLFFSPQNASGNNHHWTIISDGYYVDFMEAELVSAEGDYRKVSNQFLMEFCEFTSPSTIDWVTDFHVHFLRSDKVGPDLIFWREFIIARHIHSDLSFIRFAYADLWEIDRGEFPHVGFRPVKPEELFKLCRAGAEAAV